MKRIIVLLALLISAAETNAQILDGLKDTAKDLLSGGSLSSDEISAGLKEALVKGVTKGSDQASATDGFFKNPDIKIPFPKNARKVAKALEKIGMEKEVDNFVLALNRSAERAAGEVKPIFMDAVKEMTIEDAVNILNGKDKQAATNYLREATTDRLTEKIRPLMEESLSATDATALYGDLVSRYNKLPFVKPQNADLEDFATRKTIDGLFHLIGKEEVLIRENPGERTSDLLKKVFGSKK